MTPFRLLFVCTGNICRSPSAELLLRERLAQRLAENANPLQVSSAGLGTPGGWEIDPKVAHLLSERGITGAADHRSRQVSGEILAASDLILTGTKQHRLTIGADFPDAYSRTFTMREAVALLATGDTATLPPHDLLERGPALVALLQRGRSTRVLPDDQFDIADPHGHRTAVYKTMFQQVLAVVDVLAFVLAPASAGRTPPRPQASPEA